MKEKNVANWDDFQREREGIVEHLRKINYGTPGRLLFRGQPDSSWPLDTTLERYGNRAWRVRDYYRLISSVKSQIETLPIPNRTNSTTTRSISFPRNTTLSRAH
jgi:hypothetical protein